VYSLYPLLLLPLLLLLLLASSAVVREGQHRMPHSFLKYYTYNQQQHPPANPQMAPPQDFDTLRETYQKQGGQAPAETPTYKRRASSLPPNAPPRGTSAAAMGATHPSSTIANTENITIDPTASDTTVRSIDSRKSSSTISTTSTTFRSYCKVPPQVIDTAIATAALVDTSQSPFTQREAEEMIRIRHLHRRNPDPYFDVVGGSVGKGAECVARNSTISHPRACVTAFLRVIDELW
jgi:hypothetical protein